MSDKEYTPTTSDISRAWLLERLKDPTMKHDPDNSDAEDEFQRWLKDAHLDAAHAVALEREKIAVLIEGSCDFALPYHVRQSLAQAIRTGAHNGEWA